MMETLLQKRLPFAEPTPCPEVPSWLDVPALDPAMQADRLIAPVVKWGTIARSAEMHGTYHFYTADAKFASLRRDPHKLVASGCAVAVEPNYSTWPDMPIERFFEGLRLKRALARHWQERGMRIIVDLNVDPCFRAVALAGVPRGWRAYAVRSQRGIGLEEIEADFAHACEHAGTSDILFCVFGGWRRLRDHCKRRGWSWVPEDMHRARGMTDGTRGW